MNITVNELTKNTNIIKTGEKFFLSGTVYTARDAAHKRIIQMIEKGEKLPFDLKNSAVYYCGPSPVKPGKVIGACGPTTSARMDSFTPRMLENGVKILIGKGARSKEVVDSIKNNKALYLVATGGAAALLAKSVIKSELIAFEDLGPEAIYKLEIKDMPLIAAVDGFGNDLFKKEGK